jgi:hypothetical protein
VVFKDIDPAHVRIAGIYLAQLRVKVGNQEFLPVKMYCGQKMRKNHQSAQPGIRNSSEATKRVQIRVSRIFHCKAAIINSPIVTGLRLVADVKAEM